MFIEKVKSLKENNTIEKIDFVDSYNVEIYTNSIIEHGASLFFIGKTDSEKMLFLLAKPDDIEKVELNCVKNVDLNDGYKLYVAELTTENRIAMQKIMPHLTPKLCGVDNSFGFGDRLGVANTGHLKSLGDSSFFPILAQQSIRELTRTKRTPEEVMDAAVWAVLEVGYTKDFGSDADHLKTTEDIDLMINAGYTMFTIDPGDYVDNETDNYSDEELAEKFEALPWAELEDSIENSKERYGKTFEISDKLSIKPNDQDLQRAYVKYGKSILHVKKLHDYLSTKYKDLPSEIEVSVDETESVTTPYEHFFIVNELKRLNVKFISIAPRFIGDFEKGIDYKGDHDIFREEYIKHIDITKYFGSYKISLHSGSDKFDVYRIIGQLDNAYTHVKTAGTSYLEALRVVASVDPELFGKMFDYCLDLYEIEKKTYHVSADITTLKKSSEYSPEELLKLLDDDHARQVLHVTFGRILTDKGSDGNYVFKDSLMKILIENENVYDEFLIKHFNKHIEPFGF